jgi:hypothetical protein
MLLGDVGELSAACEPSQPLPPRSESFVIWVIGPALPELARFGFEASQSLPARWRPLVRLPELQCQPVSV